MKRQSHHFPSSRGERSTQVYLSDDDSAFVPFLEVNRASILLPISYKRTLPKKLYSGERSQERQPLVIEHEPEIYEREPVEEEREVQEQRLPDKLMIKAMDLRSKELKQELQPVENKGELEILSSCHRISVVMAFRGRGDNRLDGLKKCIKCLREQTVGCYIVLVEQDSEPVHQSELEPLVDSYLFIYSSAMFNKSWAFNCGVVIAPDDLILLHDCDLLVPKGYVAEAVKVLGTKDLVLPWAKILYLSEESSKKYPGGHPKVTSMLTSHQAVGGSVLVRKNFYLRVGGMDERFEGWGGEDNAFYAKACKLGRVARVTPMTGMTLLHHYHKPAVKWHPHNHINNHVLWQYYQASDKDIMARLRILEPIGDPLKYRNKEDSQRAEVNAVHSLNH